MISSVQWQWILLGAGPGDGGQSHRVARRRAAGGSDLVYNSGTDSPMQDSWVSSPSAPPTITQSGQEYVRAFWSVTAHDSMSSQGSAQIQPGTGTANDSHFGGTWTVAAKLYYIAWGGGSLPGGDDGAVLIDAFDIQAGDFFPDDFVDVTPDPGHTLTPAANDGYIDTTTQIQEGTALTIAARDGIPGKQFGYWWSIDSLLQSGNPATPATVGSPDRHDIVAHHNDVVVAFAFYNEVPNRWIPPNVWLYNPWWWIETHGGLVPPGPTDPFRIQLEAVSQIIEATRFLSGEVRARGIELALYQLSIAETVIRQELNSLREGLQEK